MTGDKKHKPHLWGAGHEAVEEDEKPAGGSAWCHNGRLAKPTNRTTKNAPGEEALQRALSNLAESTRACPSLVCGHVALAFFHCADVCDSEVDRREWRE